MANALSAEIRGLKEAQKMATQVMKDLHGEPFVAAVHKATLIVQRAAKINAPVRTGRLRASIMPEVSRVGGEIIGVVGTVVSYAKKVESPGPVRKHGRRPYLQPALDENKDKIIKLLDRAVLEIVDK